MLLHEKVVPRLRETNALFTVKFMKTEHLLTLLLQWRNYWYRHSGKLKSLAGLVGPYSLLGLQFWHRQTSGYSDIWKPGCIDTVYLICLNWKMQSAESCHLYIQTCCTLRLRNLWLAFNALYNGTNECTRNGAHTVVINDLETFSTLFECILFYLGTSEPPIVCFMS